MRICCGLMLLSSFWPAGQLRLTGNPQDPVPEQVDDPGVREALQQAASAQKQTPALGHLQNTVRKVACDAGVPPDFALATIERESRFDNSLRGQHGEIGASQILPRTAVALGFDPGRLATEFAYNARAGVTILKTLLLQAEGDEHKASYLYLAGPGWSKMPLEAQSNIRAYAETIQKLKRNYSGMSCD